MDNYQGDLTDILRASSGSLGQSDASISNWEFPTDPTINLSSSTMEDDHDNNRDSFFGDPFCNMRDPLLHELNLAGSGYFSLERNTTDPTMLSTTSVGDEFCGASGGGSNNILVVHHNNKVFEEDVNKNSSHINMFSRIQISTGGNNPSKLPLSPCDSHVMPVAAGASPSPRGFKGGPMVSSDIINANSSKTCLIDNTGPVEISSPRNLGIKRRKSQAKKVVCIPAPAAPNSRPSGEVVPSDLWAWRKYGQKPIKGSPYPRGYYRCSSSKGCSARKQVERSRTDPNMLVITYTSEHNHPWPTQRNALAGSTRSQPPKNSNSAASKSSSPTGSQPQKPTSKEEQKESSNDTLSPTNNVASSSTVSGLVKEEAEETDKKKLEMEGTELISEGFPQSYRPVMPDSNDQDFFTDLGEIDGDPHELLFSLGFNENDHKQGKALDPFGIFDWSTDNSNPTSFGEPKRSL